MQDVSSSDLGPERAAIAQACRLLVVAGVLEGILGHVSLRRGPDQLLVRCRGPRERGLRFTTADDVHLVGMDGASPTAPGYAAPNELPIHMAVLAARPDAQAVVHAHPPFALLAGLAGLNLPPMIGAYDIPAAELATHGVARYPRAVLVDTPELGAELVEAMGTARACLLEGHGIVTCGATLEEAVLTAIQVETLARIAVELGRLGSAARPISDRDLAQLPDLGPGFNTGHGYRHLVALLEADDRRVGFTRS